MANLHSARAPSWRYYFGYVPVNLRSTEPDVPHGGEIVFVFGTGAATSNAQAPWTPADQEMSEQVMDYWVSFAKTGAPSPEGQPEWLQETTKADETMGFGDTIELQQNFMRTRLNVFIGVLNLLGKILNRE